MSRHDARARRADNVWLVHVPDVDRTTQARSLREVEPMARDLVAVMLDVPIETVEVDVSIELPEEAQAHLVESERLRTEAARATSGAAAESRAAARALADLGLTVRDIGAAIGVSHQRAHQLLHS